VDGVSDHLFVEGPEVLDAAAAAAHNEDVDATQAVEKMKGGSDLLSRTLALDPCGADPNLGDRPAAAEDFEHIPHGSPRGACPQSDPAGVARERFLALRIEVSQTEELFAQLAKGQLQGALALGLKFFNGQLVLPAGLVDA